MELTVTVKLNMSSVVLGVLNKIETDNTDEMYLKGFYECRDHMISAVEKFIEEHEDNSEI